MKEPNTLTAPDFTDDERKWIAQHPAWRVVFMVLRLALVPAMLAGITTYFEYRAGHAEKRTDETYKAVAPVVNDTQDQVKALSQKVEILQQLVLVLAQNGNGAKPADTAGQGFGSGTGRLGAGHPAPMLNKVEDAYKAAQQRKDLVATNCMKDKLMRIRAISAEERDAIETTHTHPYAAELLSLFTDFDKCLAVDAAYHPQVKATLVEQLETHKPRAFAPKPLPASATEAVQQMTK